jgi:hypothetical protein
MEAGREADLQNPITRGGTLEPRVLIQKVYHDLVGSIISEQSLQEKASVVVEETREKLTTGAMECSTENELMAARTEEACTEGSL